MLTSKVARDRETLMTGKIFDAEDGADAAQSDFTRGFCGQGEDQFHFHDATGRPLLRKNEYTPYPYISREASIISRQASAPVIRPGVISFLRPTEQYGQLKVVTRTFSSLNKVKSGEG